MRIISGSLGGRRLTAPRGSGTRPTAERVRESLFSILGSPASGTQVLDVCAGAGALGLEALSRGADFALFVESSRAALGCLRQNIDALALSEASEVQFGDARRVLPQLRLRREHSRKASTGEKPQIASDLEFHWIFVDPPYSTGLAAEILDFLGRDDLLAEEVVVVVEHDRRNEPHSSYGCLVRTDTRRYGDTEISFYRRGSP